MVDPVRDLRAIRGTNETLSNAAREKSLTGLTASGSAGKFARGQISIGYLYATASVGQGRNLCGNERRAYNAKG